MTLTQMMFADLEKQVAELDALKSALQGTRTAMVITQRKVEALTELLTLEGNQLPAPPERGKEE